MVILWTEGHAESFESWICHTWIASNSNQTSQHPMLLVVIVRRFALRFHTRRPTSMNRNTLQSCFGWHLYACRERENDGQTPSLPITLRWSLVQKIHSLLALKIPPSAATTFEQHESNSSDCIPVALHSGPGSDQDAPIDCFRLWLQWHADCGPLCPRQYLSHLDLNDKNANLIVEVFRGENVPRRRSSASLTWGNMRL